MRKRKCPCGRVHEWLQKPRVQTFMWAADGLDATQEARSAYRELKAALVEAGIPLPVVIDDTVRQTPVIDLGKCLPYVALKLAELLRGRRDPPCPGATAEPGPPDRH